VAARISGQPKRIACRKFDMVIGRMIPAMAISGSMNSDSPEIMIKRHREADGALHEARDERHADGGHEGPKRHQGQAVLKHERPFRDVIS
jgi:hypothetical protein